MPSGWGQALYAIGVWFAEHGAPVAAGFVGGILAIVVWRRRQK